PRVSCAFSHGTGFSPRAPVMELAAAPAALWADDRGALCVDTGAAVICAQRPTSSTSAQIPSADGFAVSRNRARDRR
ncbi:MAG TPA: hypothetical protein VFQ65_00270, partial [Kofleriaceae bacterium]|nr:hypothetical protein [Kofleriaceae bacterium]